MARHEYKGAIIRKRSGVDRLGRAVSGYVIQWIDTPFSGYRFSTLRDAKAFVDAQISA
jgi:hypothetical protein